VVSGIAFSKIIHFFFVQHDYILLLFFWGGGEGVMCVFVSKVNFKMLLLNVCHSYYSPITFEHDITLAYI